MRDCAVPIKFSRDKASTAISATFSETKPWGVQVLQAAGIFGFFFVLGALVVQFTLIHLVAKAARMKNRSYRAFFWLSLILQPQIIWIIVATLPFNPYDPRSPFTDTRPSIEPEDRYVNHYSRQPLMGTKEHVLIWTGLAVMLLSIALGYSSIMFAYSNY